DVDLRALEVEQAIVVRRARRGERVDDVDHRHDRAAAVVRLNGRVEALLDVGLHRVEALVLAEQAEDRRRAERAAVDGQDRAVVEHRRALLDGRRNRRGRRRGGRGAGRGGGRRGRLGRRAGDGRRRGGQRRGGGARGRDRGGRCGRHERQREGEP